MILKHNTCNFVACIKHSVLAMQSIKKKKKKKTARSMLTEF